MVTAHHSGACLSHGLSPLHIHVLCSCWLTVLPLLNRLGSLLPVTAVSVVETSGAQGPCPHPRLHIETTLTLFMSTMWRMQEPTMMLIFLAVQPWPRYEVLHLLGHGTLPSRLIMYFVVFIEDWFHWEYWREFISYRVTSYTVLQLTSVEGKGIGRSCKLSLVMAGVTTVLKGDAYHCGLGKGVQNFNT